MSFRSFIVLMGVFCMVAGLVFGVWTFTLDPNYAVPCFVMSVAGALFIWISTLGKGSP